jgi:hypothetical protein
LAGERARERGRGAPNETRYFRTSPYRPKLTHSS